MLNIGRGHRGNVYHTPVTLMLAHAKNIGYITRAHKHRGHR